MNDFTFTFCGARLSALGSGALWWPERDLLCLSDMHLGKSERMARRRGSMLPPYESRDTLRRLRDDLSATGAGSVVCLGDSFDDLEAARALPPEERALLHEIMQGRRWVWITGNHDPGPGLAAGAVCEELRLGPLHFCHIARPGPLSEPGEVSGHYHPKARLSAGASRISRPCFLVDGERLILPAYGTYTGGLFSDAPELCALMAEDALAILLGKSPQALPMPRGPHGRISSGSVL